MMDSGDVLHYVEEMEQILSQPVNTSEDRDKVLHGIGLRVKELKGIMQVNDKNTDYGLPEDRKVENAEHHFQPTTDVLSKWKICNCNKSQCPSCKAEHEAQQSATAWIRHHGDDPEYRFLDLTNPQQRDLSQTEENESLMSLCKYNRNRAPDTTANETEISIEGNYKIKRATGGLKDGTEETQKTVGTEWSHCDFHQDADQYDDDMDTDIVAFQDYDYDDYDENSEFLINEDQAMEPRGATPRTFLFSFGQQSTPFGERNTVSPNKSRPAVGQGVQRRQLMVEMKGDLPMNVGIRFMKVMPMRQTSSLRDVSCITDPPFSDTGTASHNIIRLRPMLSASCLFGFGRPNACGVVAMLFADCMLKIPQKKIISKVNNKDLLAYAVYDFVGMSMSMGTELHRENCVNPSHCLGVNDVMLLTSHLGYELKEEKEVTSSVIDTFADALLDLKTGQILLMFRMEDYKVLSAIIGEANNDMLIFDCQSRTVVEPATNETKEHGGVIYHILQRESECVRRTVIQLEKYSGEMKGRCIIALFVTSA